jgi:ankyrin repeat protein
LESEILWAASSEEDKHHIVEEILRKDARLVHATDKDGYTPLHKACYNNNYELAQLLLKYKADPNKKTEYHWTTLHSACKWNNARLAALMLQHGADINARSEGDQTPLHITTSVSACRDTIVTLFMNPKINTELLNNSHETAAQIAKRTGFALPLFDMVDSALSVETGLID